MIKPEHIPDEVVKAALEAWKKDTETFHPNADTIAAALNAWPGAFPHTFRGPLEGYGYVLPLPTEKLE